MTPAEAAILCKVANNWLRLIREHDAPPPGEAVRAAFTALARAAPDIAAQCPDLMQLCGGQLRDTTNPLVKAGNATTVRVEGPEEAPWVTTEQAGELLGLKPDSVRAQLRRKRIKGYRHESGWRIDRASAQTYRRQGAGNDPGG